MRHVPQHIHMTTPSGSVVHAWQVWYYSKDSSIHCLMHYSMHDVKSSGTPVLPQVRDTMQSIALRTRQFDSMLSVSGGAGSESQPELMHM